MESAPSVAVAVDYWALSPSCISVARCSMVIAPLPIYFLCDSVHTENLNASHQAIAKLASRQSQLIARVFDENWEGFPLS